MKIDKKAMEAATKQFYLDCNTENSIYNNGKVIICNSQAIQGARIIEGKDLFFKAIIFLGKAYIMVDEQIGDWAVENFRKSSPEWLFEYTKLRIIDNKLKEYKREIVDTHIYYLQGDSCQEVKPIREVKWFEGKELLQFKDNNKFNSALCFSETQPDMLAVAAVDNGKLIAMAGASCDGEYLWQIGINVLPEYENQGLAVNLTCYIKQEILKRGKIPFYGTSQSHTISQSVALKAGFLPAWSELCIRKILD